MQAARIVPPTGDGRHRAHCQLCRQLDVDQLAELERLYLAWHSPAELLEALDLAEQLTPVNVRSHAAFYSLDLVRAQHRARALGRLVEAGIAAALDGQATPRDALAALKQLDDLDPGAGYGQAPTPAEPAAPVELTWEQRVRLRGQAVADLPAQLRETAVRADPVPSARAELPACRLLDV